MSEYEIHRPSFAGTTRNDWEFPSEVDFDTEDRPVAAERFLLSKSGFDEPDAFEDLALPVVTSRGELSYNALWAAKQGPYSVERIEDIDAETKQAVEQLIDDLLPRARLGEPVDESDRVDRGGVAEDAWRSVETASATLAVESAVPVQADPGRLQQLFENLIRNAVEHGGRDVEIRVGTADEAFYVADDGPGIDPTDREKLFETGFTTDEDQGTGFGLSIVEQIAEAHGWEVRICDSRDGGACFEFTGVEVSRRAEH
jgi:signal transduction histidine kinase